MKKIQICSLLPEYESLYGEVGHLLHTGGSQDDHVVVAVTAAAGGLEVVRLGGLDAAQAGAATLHVDDKCRQICACQRAGDGRSDHEGL